MKLLKKLQTKKFGLILILTVFSIVILTLAYRLVVNIVEQKRVSKPVEILQLTYGETYDALPELTVNGFIEIRFDTWMDKESTERAFRVLDANFIDVQGKITWLDETTLRFNPSHLLNPNSQYQILISTEAKTRSGELLASVFDIAFQTVNRTEGITLFPVEGATDVRTDDPIIIVFESPIIPPDIPLNSLANEKIVELSPRIEGVGSWLNASTYQFTPIKSLTSNTRYQVRVKANEINEIANKENLLSEDILWQFETLPSQVSWIKINESLYEPDARLLGYQPQPPEFLLSIKFDLPMNQQETQKEVSILDEDGNPISISSFNWKEESSLLQFFLSSLDLNTNYILRIGKDASASDGGTLAEIFEWHFQTVPPPSISYPPPNSEVDRSFFIDQFTIGFSTDIDPASLAGKIEITPNHSVDSEPYYYNRASRALTIFGLQPASTYEIHLLPGISDIFGNTINEEITYTLSSGYLEPSTHVQLPISQPAVYETGSPLEFYTTFVNIESVNFRLFQLSREQYSQLEFEREDEKNSPQITPAVSYEDILDSIRSSLSPIVNSTQVIDQETNSKITLTNSTVAGYYMLSATALNEKQEIVDEDLRFIIVSNANLTLKAGTSESLIWLTNFENGEPLRNVDVTLYRENELFVAQGTTDNDGLVHFEYASDREQNQIFYAVTEDRDYFGFARSNWSSGNEDYDRISVDNYVNFPDQKVIYLYTDRSIYRPGQTVSIKGIYRLETDLDYGLPPQADQVKLSIRKEQGGNLIFEQEQTLSAYRTFETDYTMDLSAEPGNYVILATIDDVEIARIKFNVTFYQRQTFQVDTTVQHQDMLAGSSFAAQISASYFTGGSVSNADVTLSLSESPYIFEPENDLFQDYKFVSEDFLEQYSPSYSVPVAEYYLTTNESGEASQIIPFTPSNSRVAQELTLAANVVDSTGNEVIGRDTVILHPSTYYVGIRSNENIGAVNEPQPIDVVVLDWDESPISEQEVYINIIKEEHYRAEVEIHNLLQPEYSIQQIVVEKFENQLTNSSGQITVSFTPTESGIYRFEASTQDDAGNNIITSIRVWVGDENEYLSSRFNIYKSATIVPNKETYIPGEVAEFLISSPFVGPAYALITIERGQIQHYEIVELPESGNNISYRVPIVEDMAPNAFISILILKGRDTSLPRPSFALGVYEIFVENEQNRLDIEVSVENEYVEPGEELPITIVAKDTSGLPVQAELSIAIVDLSIINQSEANSEPIFDYYYHQRSLEIKTSLPMARFAEEFNYRIQNNIPTGETMGGGDLKGDGVIGVLEIREEFPDTAYWTASIETDAEGIAIINVEMPDNITTWRIDVRGITSDTQTGQATEEIIVSKPLFITPQTPRFFVAGDELRIGAFVGNRTNESLDAIVMLDADGITLQSGETASKSIFLSENSVEFVTWQVTVDLNSTSADLTFSTNSGSLSDSSKPILGTLENNRLPIYSYQQTNFWAIAGTLTNADTINYDIPNLSSYPFVDLHVELATSFLEDLKESLTLPRQIEEISTEEFVSNILPIIHAQKISSLLNESEIKYLEDEYFSQLYSSQNNDGSWGWFQGLAGDPLTTAYVVLSLIESREAGLQIDEASLLKGVNFLERSLWDQSELRTPQQFNQQSFILYVLTRQNINVTDKLLYLFDNRSILSFHAKSFLAQSFASLNTNDPKVIILLEDFRTSVIHSDSGAYWSESSDDPLSWNTSLRTTALILNTFITLDPDESMLSDVVDWLVRRRVRNGWGTSQETAWTLVGLINWAMINDEFMHDFAYSASLNDEIFFTNQARPNISSQSEVYSFTQAQLSESQSNVLSISREEGHGTLYYTAYANVSQPTVQTTIIEDGISIEREYYAIDEPNISISQTNVGDFIVAELTVIVPKDLYFVSIQEPLPAGFDATVWSSENTKFQELSNEFGWGLEYFSKVVLSDESITLYAEKITAGVYKYFYILRASTPGTFHVLPAVGQELYSADTYGLSTESTLTVLP